LSFANETFFFVNNSELMYNSIENERVPIYFVKHYESKVIISM